MRPATSHLLSILVIGATSASLTVSGDAQVSTSIEAATGLVRLLEESGLEAAAARHPYERDRFVAALYIPGSQLLVVSARYPVPAALELRLADRAYRDIYTDLHGAGIRDGQFFVEDLGADGLRASRKPGEPFDILYEDGTRTIFDGNWNAQHLTETEYRRRFAAADRHYAELLAALTAAVRSPASIGSAATNAAREGVNYRESALAFARERPTDREILTGVLPLAAMPAMARWDAPSPAIPSRRRLSQAVGPAAATDLILAHSSLRIVAIVDDMKGSHSVLL